MSGDKHVSATFASGPAPTFGLAVTVAGAGSGVVTSNPAGISCGATCTAAFASNTSVTLSAKASSGSTFAGRSGACTGTSPTCVVSMTAAQAVTATFDGGQPVLTVTKDGSCQGTVISSPSGIGCGTICSAAYTSGTSVRLTASPAAGSDFTGWSGDCSGTSTTCTVSVTAARSVRATFQLRESTLKVTKAGTGPGSVTGITAFGTSPREPLDTRPMPSISSRLLVDAVVHVERMSFKERERFLDEILKFAQESEIG